MERAVLSFISQSVLDEGQIGAPQNRATRLMGNAAILGLSTVADLAESKLFRSAQTMIFEGKTKKIEAELEKATAEKNLHTIVEGDLNNSDQREMQKIADELQIQIIRDSLRTHKAIESGVEFAEEPLSDELFIKGGGNMMLNRLAGNVTKENKKSYVKGTAETISDYANTLIQVFANDRWIGFTDKNGKPKEFMGMYMAEKSMNFINGFNVEATLRILSDIPGVGVPVRWMKGRTDKLLESPLVPWVNKAVGKFLLGFHVSNTRTKAVERATAEIASKTI